jgi:hypothetical protein
MAIRSLFAALAAAFVLVAGPAFAHSVNVGSLEITDLWARATPPKAPTAGGFLTITNNGTDDDTLVAVSTPMAGKSELHKMEMKDGVMIMRPVEGGITIPAGGSVTLAPGGLHLMFMKLTGAFKEGETVPVTLTFAKAGSVDTFLHVLSVGAKGPNGDAGDTHDMKM